MLIRILIVIAMFAMYLLWAMRSKLPPATENGRNTFGVKINGKVWLPVTSFYLIGGPQVLQGYYGNNELKIVARKGISDEALTLVVADIKSTGIYKLKGTNQEGISASRYDRDLIDDAYSPFPGGVNTIHITRLDTTHKIVSGTFGVQLKGKSATAIMNLTEGVFDLKY